MGLNVMGSEFQKQLASKTPEELSKMSPKELVAEQQRLQRLVILHSEEAMQQQFYAIKLERELSKVVNVLSKKL